MSEASQGGPAAGAVPALPAVQHEQWALQVIDAWKSFGATQALRGVDLTVAPGTIHILLGANGSGKSTLIRALAGYHSLDSGSMLVYGREVAGHEVSKESGLRFIHQDLALIPTLSVADNLAVSRGYVQGRSGTIRWVSEYANARRQLADVGLGSIDPRRQTSELSPVERTLVAVARALDEIDPARNILVLDEPTARLPQEQAARLIASLKDLSRRGLPVLYITHRLEELKDFGDAVTVLRDGRVVFSGAPTETSTRDLQTLIAGIEPGAEAPTVAVRDEAVMQAPRTGDGETPVLEVRGVSSHRLKNIDFFVRRGELCGVTGLVGSGRSELGRVIYGVQNYSSGEVRISGALMPQPRTKARLSRRVGYLPQERAFSVFSNLTIEDNVTMASLANLESWYGISKARARAASTRGIKDLKIRPPDPTRLLAVLSGGNQQKVALARWFQLPLDLLILDEPTQSIDVGAKADLMAAIKLRCQTNGLAVLWLDSDIDELVSYADRILVMTRGEISAEFVEPPFRSAEIIAAAYGRAPQEASK